MSAALQKLLQEKDAFFHGSPVKGMVLIEPRRADDAEGKEFNIDTAIFATSDPAVAIIFALVNRDSVPMQSGDSWSVDMTKAAAGLAVQASLPETWRAAIEGRAVGYVYVLPAASFGESDGLQWKSKVAVKPLHCVEVTEDDFYAAGGKIIWR